VSKVNSIDFEKVEIYKLKKFKLNQPLIKNFTNFIKDLKTTDDPARLGELKHGLQKLYWNTFDKIPHSDLLCRLFKENSVVNRS
jgi:hypothetical protein